MSTEDRLRSAFKIMHLEITDESAQHAGHNPSAALGGTHIRVVIVSPDFEKKSRLERHRAVYDAVFDDFSGPVHALAVKAFTPSEWNQR